MIDFYGAVVSIDSITHRGNEEKNPNKQQQQQQQQQQEKQTKEWSLYS